MRAEMPLTGPAWKNGSLHDSSILVCPEHIAPAGRIAEESITLVKNARSAASVPKEEDRLRR